MLAEETRNVDPIRITLIAAVVVMTLLGMGFVIAIMRQRNAVNAVVNAHGRLMDALENAAHGVALFDFDDGLLHINARFASLHPGENCELQSGLSFHAVASVLNRASCTAYCVRSYFGQTQRRTLCSSGLVDDGGRWHCVGAL